MGNPERDCELGTATYRGTTVRFISRRPVGALRSFVVQTVARDGSTTEETIAGDAVARALRDSMSIYLRDIRGCYRCTPRGGR